MFESLLQLIILFLVIFDPPASFSVFFTVTKHFSNQERRKTATYAIFLALALSVLVILLGEQLLLVFSTNIHEFKIAGGIILALLGIRMSLGMPVVEAHTKGRAISAIIATPLLTGPASITAIIVSVGEHGRMLTFISVLIVLIITAILFYQAQFFRKLAGETSVQVISTLLGLITLAWGVRFIMEGILALI